MYYVYIKILDIHLFVHVASLQKLGGLAADGAPVVAPLAPKVGDGVGTNLADINFQDAQAVSKKTPLGEDWWSLLKGNFLMILSNEKTIPKNTPS